MYWHNSCDRDHGLRVPPRTCVLCEVNHSGLLFAEATRRPSADTFKPMASARKRLDTVLVERGLFESRSKAAAAVVAGDVLVGDERRQSRQARPGGGSRGRARRPRAAALRLARRAEAGARAGCPRARRGRAQLPGCGRLHRRVHRLPARSAERRTWSRVDVAYGELHWSLRQDPRVTVLERSNVRALEPAALPVPPGPDRRRPVVHRARQGAAGARGLRGGVLRPVALVKPQFELGPDRVGKGGVVRSPDDRLEALVAAGEAAHGRRHERARLRVVRPPGPGGKPRELHLVHRGCAARRGGPHRGGAPRPSPRRRAVPVRS